MKKQKLIAELFSAADDGASSAFDNEVYPRAAGLTRLSQAAVGAASLAFAIAPAAGQDSMSVVMDQLDVTLSGAPAGSSYNPRQLQLQRLPTPILDTRPRPPSAEERALTIQPEDIAAAAVFAARMPPRTCMAEMTITPTDNQFYRATAQAIAGARR